MRSRPQDFLLLRSRSAWLRVLASLGLLTLLTGLAWGWYQWRGLYQRVKPSYPSAQRPQLFAAPDSQLPVVAQPPARWWTHEPFSVPTFQDPDRRYHPWVRWYWPGLKVEPLELLRELQALSARGIGGVSIQLTSAGLAPSHRELVPPTRLQPQAPRLSYLLRMVLREAAKRGLGVDWMSPTGWPQGTAGLAPADQLHTLAFGEAHVRGGKPIDIALPPPELPAAYYLNGYLSARQAPDLEPLHWQPEKAHLLALYAAKAVDNQRHPLALILTDYLALHPDSLLPINTFVEAGRLRWQAPAGYWEILAVYQMPVGQAALWGGSHQAIPLANPYSPEAVRAEVDALAGTLPLDTLVQQAGSWRGLSFGPYAWQAEQAFSRALLDSFAVRAGYPLRPLLPVLAYPGRDNLLLNQLNPHRAAAYRLTPEDARIRHDVRRVSSQLLLERHLLGQQQRTEALGLLQRTRPYGLDWDLIQAAGRSHIPTASQAFAGGSALFLKQISSGAILYGRPLIACDALMHHGQAGAMSPHRVKQAVDKLFTAGFNQIEWQGYPYCVQDTAQYGHLGWHPYASPRFGWGAFSAHLGESSFLWKHWPSLNRYVARCQYALQQGVPQIDVLVYYPFLGFPSAWADEAHEEAYFNGCMPGVNDTVPPPWRQWGLDWWETETDEPRLRWLRKVWPTLQVLENLGYTWAWANDDLLQQVGVEQGRLSLHGRPYGMVFLPEIEAIEFNTLAHLVELARAGGPVWLYGDSPTRQPGYYQYQTHDSLIRRLTRELEPTLSPENTEDLKNLLLADPPRQALAYAGYYPFLRYTKRRLPDGSSLWFLRNRQEKDRFFELNVLAEYDHFYWLDPEDGACYETQLTEQGRIKGFLGGFEAMILYARRGEPLADSLLRAMPLLQRGPSLRDKLNEQTLTSWQMMALHPSLSQGQLSISDTTLFDWRQQPLLRHHSGEALYTVTFELADTLADRTYLLDLGQVAEVVEIRLNTHNLGTLRYPPYRLEVTPYLLPGDNTLELWVEPALRNSLVGMAQKGHPGYASYLHLPLLPAGLQGPVRLIELLAPLELSN